MVKSEKNPGGLPLEVFDGFRQALVANRAQFFLGVASGPFYGFNRGDAKVSDGVIRQLVAPGHDGRRQCRTTIASRRSRKPISPRT